MKSRIPIGDIAFGDLRRLTPISTDWGFDRGGPIDRHYIDQFFGRHAGDVQGHVLEIGSAAYTHRFGGSRVTRSDVLNIANDSGTTIVADLANAPHIGSEIFNCVILTQTLQYIYDLRAAVHTLHRILQPNGVILATFPGISRTTEHYPAERLGPEPATASPWMTGWCWSLTPVSARLLFEECFDSEAIEIAGYGNVLAAISFLHGLGVEELTGTELEYYDAGYEVVMGLRARKA